MSPSTKSGSMSLGIVLVVFTLIVFLYLQIRIESGEGRVLDSATKQPISNADVKFECHESLLHGSRKLRDVEVITDGNGSYTFSFSDLYGCDYGYIRVAKTGYQDPSTFDGHYRNRIKKKIPKVRYLTKKADLAMLKFMNLNAWHGVYLRNGGRSHVSEYDQWYEMFIRSKIIAKNEKEKKFIIGYYCDQLASLYSHLGSEDLEKFKGKRYEFWWNKSLVENYHNYEKEVVNYCNSS